MKRVLFIAATLGGGGAERVMLNLANRIQEKGHQVVILKTAEEKNPDGKYRINQGIKLETVSCEYKNKIKRIIYKFIKIRTIIKKYSGYSIVSFLPDVNIYTILASAGLRNRIVISERNDPGREPGNVTVRKIRDVVYKWTDFIVFQTKDAQNYFCKSIREKSCIIPNPVNLRELPQISFDISKRDVIVMFCRVKPQKNIGMLIDAIDFIREKIGNTCIEIYGDGNLYREQMKEKVKKLKLEQTIKFMGPTQDVYSIMQTSKIYVSTSDYEGISNTMLEALAIGTPCIVTDCPAGGARMFIKNNENGILIPVSDYKKLGKEIIRLLKSPEL